MFAHLLNNWESYSIKKKKAFSVQAQNPHVPLTLRVLLTFANMTQVCGRKEQEQGNPGQHKTTDWVNCF
jgi:hypothetical protein